MPSSISSFMASFQSDLARPNRFDVSIPVPLTLIPFRNSAQKLSLRCQNAALPNRNFLTAEQKIYGPVEKYPYMSSYTDATMTFLVSGDMSEKIFFDSWMEFINPLYSNNYKYKGDYAVPITITQYNLQNEPTYSINLVDAYPTSVSDMELDWSSDGVHRLTVVFAYTKWENNSIQALAMNMLEAGISRLTDSFGGLGGNAVTGGLGTAIGGVENFISGDGGSPLGDNPSFPEQKWFE